MNRHPKSHFKRLHIGCSRGNVARVAFAVVLQQTTVAQIKGDHFSISRSMLNPDANVSVPSPLDQLYALFDVSFSRHFHL